ncbi:hypothetical protein QS257_08500 [Terrilactibacillus sp. S3-3]|nr:hypothetical protein QS257_08500 [Terrilactibacillus sp. S3-3]
MAQDMMEVISSEESAFRKLFDTWPADGVSDNMVVCVDDGTSSDSILGWLKNILDRRPEQPVVYLYISESGLMHPLNLEAIQLEQAYDRFHAFPYFSRPSTADDDSWLENIPQSTKVNYYCSGSKTFMKRIYSALKETANTG